jgi:hypothetical protein
MKRVMNIIVMKKNLVSLFIYYHENIDSKYLDEEDDLSEDEVSANPVEGKSNFFSIKNENKIICFRSTKR